MGRPPAGYTSVSLFLVLEDIEKELGFLQTVFAAELRTQTRDASGVTRFAEALVGGSVIMLEGASAEFPPTPGAAHVWVDDVDAVYARALEAGASALEAPVDRTFALREAKFKDPLGNRWWIAQKVKRTRRDLQRLFSEQRRERL